LYTILGLQKTLNIGLTIPIALTMGIVSAVFGGVLRDILTNNVPLIFRKEIYATACLAGGVVYLVLGQVSGVVYINMIVAMLTVFIIRVFSGKIQLVLKI